MDIFHKFLSEILLKTSEVLVTTLATLIAMIILLVDYSSAWTFFDNAIFVHLLL